MADKNLDSLAKKGGEFHCRKPGSEPLTDKGHKPGVKVGKDAAPEFSAEVHPPGTAPTKDTYEPNPVNEFPAQAVLDDNIETARGGAIHGTTSNDVHNATSWMAQPFSASQATHWGKPIQGQTSQEAHQARETSPGLEGRVIKGRSVVSGDGSVDKKARATGADLEGPAADLKGQRGKSGVTEGGLNWPGAESQPPVGAEHVAAEI